MFKCCAEHRGRKRSAASAASWEEEEDPVQEAEDAVDLTEDDTRISQVLQAH